jgi:serine/threonine protein kinase/Tol biopolymer transport system component
MSEAISIGPGTRLGPYEIQSFLDAGGMGVVYRARDPRLNRLVAIKVLPEALVGDVSRLQRFEAEARAAGALDHPNVLVVYDIGRHQGIPFIVSELLEGETLRDRLTESGAIPPRKALEWATQIAQGLAAAHAKGIIHRDLKPKNLFLTRDGRVKILDFGLAKLIQTEGDEQRAHPDQPTVSAEGLTGSDARLGTVGYMAPEQVRGQPVGPHTDIFALGIVLYEMLVGTLPFQRDTPAETLTAILKDDPPGQPAFMPPALDRVVRRCLEKRPDDRFHSAHDLSLALEALSSGSGPVSGVSDAAAPLPVVSRVRRAAVVCLPALGAAALAATLMWLLRPTDSRPVVRTVIEPATVNSSGTDRNVAFTPNGRRLVYISRDARQILVRPLDALEPVPILTTPAYLRGVVPSPDGQWIGYVENNFTLRKIPVSGGAPTTVVQMDGPSRGAAWGPDGRIVFATGAAATGLQLVSADGGAVTVLTRPNTAAKERDHISPAWLADGRSILFTILPAGGDFEAASIAVLDTATGAWRTVLRGGAGARYIDSGHLLYVAAGTLRAVRFDLSRLSPSGAPVEILSDIAVGRTGAVVDFDVAGDGTLVYLQARGSLARERVPVWVERDGRETPLPAPPDEYLHPRISPDGRHLAIVARGDIYVWDLGRPWSTASRMTFTPAMDWFPVWTHDGRRLVFGAWRDASFSNLYVQNLETKVEERLTDSAEMQLPTSMTRNGTVIFHSFLRSLQALPPQARAEPITLVETPLEERNGEISPDGRWLAYEGESASNPGEVDIYVREFPDVNRGMSQVTRGGGMFPVWARNRRELFYMTPDGTVAAVPVESVGRTWQAGGPTPLFRGTYLVRDGSLGRQYDVAEDGRFLMLKEPSRASRFVLVQNWVTELARRLP